MQLDLVLLALYVFISDLKQWCFKVVCLLYILKKLLSFEQVDVPEFQDLINNEKAR